MTGQGVCASERDDAEGGGGLAGLRHKTLENLMDGAVASAGKDDFSALVDGFPGLDGGGAGSRGSREFDAIAKSGESLSDLAELLRAKMPVAA